MAIEPYLFFEGRTEEALDFYRKSLGAEIVAVLRYKDSPEPARRPDGTSLPADKVMHSLVRIGGSQIMASDGFCSGKPQFGGFSLTYNAKDAADARRRFDALADGGQVQMPLGETFFAKSFGMLADKFGVSWMVIAGPKNP